MTLEYSALSDIGRVRSINEDSYHAEPPLFAVADGLGGHQAGEVASRVAIDTLAEQAPTKADPKALARAVRAANRAVISAAEQGRGRAGMGTTMTAAAVDGLYVALAHVGDSRAYILHDRGLERLTEDHSVVADMVRQGTLTEEESRYHPNRSVITRALGSDPNMRADSLEIEASPGDRLLLCTDGLTAVLTDPEIERLLRQAASPDAAARSLVMAANEAGGPDNITVVVVDLSGETGEQVRAERRRRPGALLWFFTALVLVAAVVVSGYAYARTRAYLVAQSGVVVVYRGMPDSFAGVRLSWREKVSDVPIAALPPKTQQRLAQGIQVKDLTTAYKVLDEYSREASPAAGTPSSIPTAPATPPSP